MERGRGRKSHRKQEGIPAGAGARTPARRDASGDSRSSRVEGNALEKSSRGTGNGVKGWSSES